MADLYALEARAAELRSAYERADRAYAELLAVREHLNAADIAVREAEQAVQFARNNLLEHVGGDARFYETILKARHQEGIA